MTDLVRVSASQIKDFRRCRRLWAFGKIDGIVAPTTDKQGFGTETHTHLERWLKHGAPPDDSPAGQVAKQTIRHGWLPTPATHLLVEHGFEMDIGVPGAVMVGFVDCLDPEVTPVIVIDNKTTSDLKWAMTEAQLAEDVQAITYVCYAMARFEVDEVLARWLYSAASYPKDGRSRRPTGARKVEHLFRLTDLAFVDQVRLLREDVAAIRDARLAWKSANVDAPPTPTACGMYGGCAHRKSGACQLTDEQRLLGQMRQHDREHLRNTAQCDNKGSTVPTPEKEERPMDLLSKLKNMKPDNGQTAPAVAAPAPVAAPAVAQPVAAPVAFAAPAAAVGGLLDRLKNLGNAQAVNPAPVNPAPAPAPAEAVKGIDLLGSLKKAVAAPPAEKAQQAAPAAASPTDAPTSTPHSAEGLVVLYDCAFRKRPHGFDGVTNLADWVAPVCAAVAKDNGVEHWGLIDFAKGGPMLAAKVEKALKASPPCGIILADSASAEGRALRDVLTRYAGTVIAGLR